VIGVVIVTHYRLAEEFLRALELIVGKLEHVRAIGLDPTTGSPEEMRQRIEKAIGEVESGQGVLVMVDMFGGTPSNLSLAFLEEGQVEVVTGLNLPMLVKSACQKEDLPLHELAELAQEYGRRNISVATDILAGREKAGDGS
jgi:PTS system mannose-specific IIA component